MDTSKMSLKDKVSMQIDFLEFAKKTVGKSPVANNGLCGLFSSWRLKYKDPDKVPCRLLDLLPQLQEFKNTRDSYSHYWFESNAARHRWIVSELEKLNEKKDNPEVSLTELRLRIDFLIWARLTISSPLTTGEMGLCELYDEWVKLYEYPYQYTVKSLENFLPNITLIRTTTDRTDGYWFKSNKHRLDWINDQITSYELMESGFKTGKVASAVDPTIKKSEPFQPGLIQIDDDLVVHTDMIKYAYPFKGSDGETHVGIKYKETLRVPGLVADSISYKDPDKKIWNQLCNKK